MSLCLLPTLIFCCWDTNFIQIIHHILVNSLCCPTFGSSSNSLFCNGYILAHPLQRGFLMLKRCYIGTLNLSVHIDNMLPPNPLISSWPHWISTLLVDAGWWFGTFFYFPFHIWDNPSHWLSYFSEGWLNHQPDWIQDQGLLRPHSFPLFLIAMGHRWPSSLRFSWCSSPCSSCGQSQVLAAPAGSDVDGGTCMCW